MEKWALILLLRMQMQLIRRVGYQVPMAIPLRVQEQFLDEGDYMTALLHGEITMAEFASRYPVYESRDQSGE